MYVLRIKRDRCKGCGLCIKFCPKGHLVLDTDLNARGVQPVTTDNRDDVCTACGNCTAICPEVAIEIDEVEEQPAAEAPDKTEKE